MLITVLLRALGLLDYDKIIELFGENQALINTINKEIIRKRTEFGMDILELSQKLDENGNVIDKNKKSQ